MCRHIKLHYRLLFLLCSVGAATSFAYADNKADVKTYVTAARTALQQNNPTAARAAAEHYFFVADDTANERNEMATTLKWALLTGGQLNEDFLSYNRRVPEMELMLPMAFPAIDIAKPYTCLMMACGLYVPAMSTMICVTDRDGTDVFSARLMADICIETGRLSLARRYISYLPADEQVSWYCKLQEGKQALWAWDSLPYHLASEPGSTDAWVAFFYPTNAAEKSALNLKPSQSRCLLDYYTLLQLLHKRLDRLPSLIEAYREEGAERLPTYVQEALLLQMNYLNGGASREELLQWRNGNLQIEPAVLERFEMLFYDFMALRQGVDNWNDMLRNYNNSYVFYFIFDGIVLK